MKRLTREEQIIASVIDDLDHEAKVFTLHSDLPRTNENLFKLQLIGENFVSLFKVFEKHLESTRGGVIR